MKKFISACFLFFAAASVAVGQEVDVVWAPEQFVQELEAKNFQSLDAHILAMQMPVIASKEQGIAYSKVLGALTRETATWASRFDEWVTATDSGPAHLVRGEYRLSRAWLARGSAYAYKTHPDAFRRMEELLTQAKTDFNHAYKLLGKQCDWCVASLVQISILQNDRDGMVAQLDTLLKDISGGYFTPSTYLLFLQPKWGGSWEEMDRFIRGYIKDFPTNPIVPVLKSNFAWAKGSALQDQQRYAEAYGQFELATEINPTNSGAWAGMADSAMREHRDVEALAASEKALAINPLLLTALTARADVLLRSPTPLDAVPFLERAVAQGSDWALEAVLPIIASGKYGFKPDPVRAERICLEAVEAFRPAGMACQGGLYYFGLGRPVNKTKALEWFLAAADRGFVRAMMDAALMLSRGDGVPRDVDRAVSLWLQAHAAGEPSAENMLRNNLSSWDYFWKVSWPRFVNTILGVFRALVGR